jgi:hypothetical protein
VFIAIIQKAWQIIGLDGPALTAGGCLNKSLGPFFLGCRNRLPGQPGQDHFTLGTPGLHQELMILGIDYFGEGKIEPDVSAGTGSQRGAKTRTVGFGAVDRHDKQRTAASRVHRVSEGTVEQGPVMNGNSRQFTGPDADQGKGRHIVREGLEGNVPLLPHGPKQRHLGGKKELLPGFLAQVKTKVGLISAADKPKKTGVSLSGPTLGQVGNTA